MDPHTDSQQTTASKVPAEWGQMPADILVAVTRYLSLKDQKVCTIVCRHWNDVIFNASINGRVTFPLSKWNPNASYVLFSGFLPTFQRFYRSVELSWINHPGAHYLLAIDQIFEGLSKNALQKLTIHATPDDTLGKFFERHRSVFNQIRQLHVFIESPFKQYPVPIDGTPLEIRQCFIDMHSLDRLHWTEASLGNSSHGRQYFMIDAPLLTQAIVETLRNWNCYTVVNIKSCTKLNFVMLDLPNRIWRTFPNNSFDHLDVLNITTSSIVDPVKLRITPIAFLIENIRPIKFDQLFRSMKNLRTLSITGIEDDALLAVCQSCTLIKSIKLKFFKIDFLSFVQLGRFKMLRDLNLSHGKIIGCKGKIVCESLQTLQLSDVALVNGEYKKFPLALNDNMARKLLYSKRNDEIICNN